MEKVIRKKGGVVSSPFPDSEFDDILRGKQNLNKPELGENFSQIDTSEYPDFYSFKKPLEQGLWVLLIAKEKLNIKRLTADEISKIIINVKEISTDAKSITYAFNRAKDKIHIHNKINYEIMKPGKDYLISQTGNGPIDVFYFEPDKKYTNRKILSTDIFKNLKGDLRIVDPYCGERTLEILHKAKNKIQFLTRIDNLQSKDKQKFLKELQDFKSEFKNVEFKDYKNSDIHDRYIISGESLVILGHSIRSLGDKESFAIILNAQANRNILEALSENFNRRWKSASIL